jgi:FkbM family methyltransferase
VSPSSPAPAQSVPSEPNILDAFPFNARAGVERVRQVWRVALHRKFTAEVRLLAPFMPAGTGVLDIGANHGRFAAEAARAPRSARVLAFEPLPFNLRILRASSGLVPGVRSRVRIVPCALGERREQLHAYVPLRPDNRPIHGATFLAPSDERARAHTPGQRLVRQPVRVERLDDQDLSFLPAGRVGFVKMDVEGHEAAVLRGGRTLLAEQRPSVLLEVWGGPAGRAALDELAALGYLLCDLERREHARWTPDPAVLSKDWDPAKSHDVLAWHPSTHPDAPASGPPAFPDGGFDRTRFGR